MSQFTKSLHEKHGHPFHPWKNEDEFWLADFMFTKAKMSMTVSDNLLGGIRYGQIKMRGCDLSHPTYKHLMDQLDKEQFVTVSVVYF